MKSLAVVAGAVFCCAAVSEEYQHGPDSMPSESVPHGKVTQHELLKSSVFPGTKRRYSVYVPAQYDGSSPAALMSTLR